jgi:phosphatidylserine/phosphatidylglycerophosphate/cardiolipin synthase-like enzyme/uncharacterized membrane protein YdjX (TVP38/TMEM64 family)
VILSRGQNVWRIERASRGAILIDGACYFGALRESLLKARSSIFILAWDLDSRVRLVGESGRADDGLPENFVDFLSALVEREPNLVINVLLWDYSMLYSLERDPVPVSWLQWRTPKRLRFCLGDDLPAGAAHHQKLIVIDDVVAFCGGLDVTIRRWDTCEHMPKNPQRIDPAGDPYPPFHDVQALVEGDVARALGELARERWSRGACERTPPAKSGGDAWPESVAPDFRDITVGIARTLPLSDEHEEIREVERLYLDSIARAERSIYIENQYLTFTKFAQALSARMREVSELEAVFVMPKGLKSWLEAGAMELGRARFLATFAEAGLCERVQFLHPAVERGGTRADVMVHSKVMVVDDVLLHVGSSNLNNRSMGLDSECDLAIEAQSAQERAAIRRVRDKLLAHHCGRAGGDLIPASGSARSLVEVAARAGCNGHSLQPIAPPLLPDAESAAILAEIGDAERPIPLPVFVRDFVGERPPARRVGKIAKLIGIALVVITLVLAWRLTPLADFTDPERVRRWADALAEMDGALVFVVGAFVLGSLIAFPVTLMIAATAATFGPVFGFLYAALGALVSGVVTYFLGVWLGRGTLDALAGPRINRIRRSIRRRGVLAIATVRLLPIAPFTLVNLVAGASRIPLSHFVLGTAIGILPGLTVMSLLGHQIFNVMTQPTLGNTVLFILGVIGWVALSVGMQALMLRTRRAKP